MRDVNINIVIAVNIAFMLLYTLSIDALVRRHLVKSKISADEA